MGYGQNGMYPSYPSITFPNHYSIITGLYPSHHGLVDNIFYDPNRKEMYKIGSKTVTDGSWYGGLPLWGLAEKQGMVAASLFWVGSRVKPEVQDLLITIHITKNFRMMIK